MEGGSAVLKVMARTKGMNRQNQVIIYSSHLVTNRQMTTFIQDKKCGYLLNVEKDFIINADNNCESM